MPYFDENAPIHAPTRSLNNTNGTTKPRQARPSSVIMSSKPAIYTNNNNNNINASTNSIRGVVPPRRAIPKFFADMDDASPDMDQSSVFADKSTLRDTYPSAIAAGHGTGGGDKMRELEKALRAMQKNIKAVEGNYKRDGQVTDAKFHAIESRISNLEADFALFQTTVPPPTLRSRDPSPPAAPKQADSSPRSTTVPELQIDHPTPDLEADTDTTVANTPNISACASPPVPAIRARRNKAALLKRMSWMGPPDGIDLALELSQDPFGARAGSSFSSFAEAVKEVSETPRAASVEPGFQSRKSSSSSQGKEVLEDVSLSSTATAEATPAAQVQSSPTRPVSDLMNFEPLGLVGGSIDLKPTKVTPVSETVKMITAQVDTLAETLRTMETRAREADEAIETMGKERNEMMKEIEELRELTEVQTALRGQQTAEMDDLRSQLDQLKNMIPKSNPIENEFAKLYLIEVRKREALEEELKSMKERSGNAPIGLGVGVPYSRRSSVMGTPVPASPSVIGERSLYLTPSSGSRISSGNGNGNGSTTPSRTPTKMMSGRGSPAMMLSNSNSSSNN